ncbi:hypothetical protein B0H66DRAFT_578362 [Apodospora peruviana]|uniref:N-acetylgalactosaminide beta-1,3-galactosyltransferase n=1 Tax=Apodospora peruviana TaxID=516989 RepID=A0AAE0HUQ5_9PEZI|nr:hypothetical protein B0H66DRAFT_578362 [Apodospora peruviana]
MMSWLFNAPATTGLHLKLNKRLGRTTALIFSLLVSLFLCTSALRGFKSPPPYINGPVTTFSSATSWLPFLVPANQRQPPPTFYPFEATSAFSPVAHDDVHTKATHDLCASFPTYLTQRIQPVLKMGHGEDHRKRDAQLDSVSACFPPDDLLIFSDFDEPLANGTRKAIDILANLPQPYRDDNPDFANYEAMRELVRKGKLTPQNDPTTGKNGWRLDKYKFLAEVERAWLMRPGRDWYVFYETDTYIVWDNMFRFLSTLDPQTPLYMGSPSPGRVDDKLKLKTWFANGGPGFVLSRGAMEKLLNRASAPVTGQYTDASLSLAWLDLIRADCCGDSVLGWALWSAGIPLSGFFPLFNPYPTHGIPYSDRAWCQPVLTMHKPEPNDMVELWRWEHGRRKLGRPLLYADLYEFRRIGSGSAPAIRYNWDNTNYDRVANGHDVHADSLEACTKACEAEARCKQYMWRGEQRKSCVLMPFINLGVAKEPETIESNETLRDPQPAGGGPESPKWRIVEERFNFTSGWLPVRIGKWRDENECTEPDWLWPSIDRHF